MSDNALAEWLRREIDEHSHMLKQHTRIAEDGDASEFHRATGRVMARARKRLIDELLWVYDSVKP